jgi:hypothetical protein
MKSAVLVLLLAACKQSVDHEVAEKLVKKVLEKEQIKAPTEVSCPSSQPIQVGTQFDCTANAAGHVEITLHLTEVDHTSPDDIVAEGAGGDYRLVATLDDAIVTRRRIAAAIPGADASKCPEAQKLKPGDTATCDVTIGTAKKKAAIKRSDAGVEIVAQ